MFPNFAQIAPISLPELCHIWQFQYIPVPELPFPTTSDPTPVPGKYHVLVLVLSQQMSRRLKLWILLRITGVLSPIESSLNPTKGHSQIVGGLSLCQGGTHVDYK